MFIKERLEEICLFLWIHCILSWNKLRFTGNLWSLIPQMALDQEPSFINRWYNYMREGSLCKVFDKHYNAELLFTTYAYCTTKKLYVNFVQRWCVRFWTWRHLGSSITHKKHVLWSDKLAFQRYQIIFLTRQLKNILHRFQRHGWWRRGGRDWIGHDPFRNASLGAILSEKQELMNINITWPLMGLYCQIMKRKS